MIVAFLSALVVFCTTYALILPAITLEKKERELACPLSIHQHTEGCYQEVSTALGGTEKVLTCGLADYVVHVHNEDCVDSDGNLVCKLPQIEAHHHSDSCYEAHQVLVCSETESEGHVHGPDCYTREQGELICEDTSEEHVHTDECYNWTETLTCGMEEGQGAHQHTDGCYQTENVLTCGKQELHTHSASCYDGNGALVCGLLELHEHVHAEACFAEAEDEQQKLSEEEQEQVDALIAAFPTKAETDATVAGYGDDVDGAAADQVDGTAALAEEPSYVYNITLKDGTVVTMTRMIEYAAATDGSDVKITISDTENKVLQPNADGEYEVTAGEQYNVNFLYTGNVLAKGKYYITFTSTINDFTQGGNLTFIGNNGDSVDLGTWSFAETSDSTVLLVFDITANMQHYSNITLGANVACTFDFENNDLDFDGGINITVKPGQTTGNTEVNKWPENIDGNRIKWGSEIYGYSNSHIVGGTITDTLTTPDTHHYTQEDKVGGITFYAKQYQPGAALGGNEGVIAEHSWKALPGDEGLDWQETGWSYKMPETVICRECNEKVSLGDAQWFYSFSYTSTMINPGSEGYTVYENKIEADGDEDEADVTTGLYKPTGTVVKNGHYNHVELTKEQVEQNGKNPYAEDTFVWDITATIPAAAEGEKYICTWRFYDGMTVGKSNQSYEPQDLTVTAQIGGETYTVYEYSDSRATESPICYRNSYTSSSSGAREFDFYCKCHCTAETCGYWRDVDDDGVDECGTQHSRGWCECWNIQKDTIITFRYSTAAGDLTVSSGGQTLVNNVELGYTQYPEGNKANNAADTDDADVKIPGLFTKVQTEAPTEDNHLEAEYAITVNEGMADLKTNHQGITIEDRMSKTLNYMSGSLRVTREDADGNAVVLTNEKDYTVTYDTKDAKNNILTIVLKEDVLGPYRYTLIYDASVRGTSDNQSTYQNTADVFLFGESRNVDSGTLQLPSAAASAVTYSAILVKQDKETEARLKDAVFKLCQAVEDGEDITMATYTTDKYGRAEIRTDTGIGVIFNAHVLYYLEETIAPEGYQLDSTKHYFWFCDNDEQINCSKEDDWSMPPVEGQCIYSIHQETNTDWNHIVVGNNPIPDGYELPETGGFGTAPYTIGGLLLTGAGLLLLYKKKRSLQIKSQG